MRDQHTLITGYRDLTQAEIDLMNRIKAKGAELEALVAEVRATLKAQADASLVSGHGGQPSEEALRIQWAEPGRWLAMANTDLQVGIMKLVRAVAQPQSF